MAVTRCRTDGVRELNMIGFGREMLSKSVATYTRTENASQA